MMKPTGEQISMMRHALGIPDDATSCSMLFSRNYYCSATEDPPLVGLCEMGLMHRGRMINEGRDQYFHVTDEGQTEVRRSVHGE